MNSKIQLATKTDQELKAWIENYERNGKTEDNFYVELIEEYSRRKHLGLKIEKSLEVLSQAAKERRFVSYGDLAKASAVAWSTARHAMNGAGGHLDNIVSYCYGKKLPLLSALCVNAASLETGELEENALKGFIAAAHRLRIPVTDEEAFYRRCQAECFEWGSHQK